MESPSLRTPVRYLGLWTSLAVVSIVALGIFAWVQGPEASRNHGVTLSNAGWGVVILFLVSLMNVAVSRLMMLPALARREDASPDKVATMAYLLALTPVIYGIAGVALSGAASVSLPFTLLSLFAAADLWALFAGVYGKEAQAAATPEAVHDVEAPVASPARRLKETVT